jgi:hypothetical protein
MGIKAMLEEEADELARGLNESDQAKDLTAPLVSAEPEIASMVSILCATIDLLLFHACFLPICFSTGSQPQ